MRTTVRHYKLEDIGKGTGCIFSHRIFNAGSKGALAEEDKNEASDEAVSCSDGVLEYGLFRYKIKINN